MKVQTSTAKNSSPEHKCALCPYSTRIFQTYKKHVKMHSAKPINCPRVKCSFQTKYERNIKQHLKHVHLLPSPSQSQSKSGSSQARPFPCPHSGCSYAAQNKYKLKIHSKTHSDEKSLFCSQPNCNFSTHYKNSLIIHSRIHTGEKPYVCQFESCTYASATSSHLQVHSRSHTKERPYKCLEPNCEYAAAERAKLKTHQVVHEPKEGEERSLFQCPIELCEYSTKTKGNLSKHVTRHNLEKPFVCSFESCEFRCNSKGNLSIHLKTHSEERQYKCELCPFRGKTRTVVSTHLHNVHSDPNFRPFKCTHSQCSSAFKTKSHLKDHLLIHNGEKKYACSFPSCDYRAIAQYMVNRHQMRAHEVEKRYKCELCPFATKDKTYLVRHVRTHTKEEPYFCKEDGCQYRAKQPGLLRQHEKKNHL